MFYNTVLLAGRCGKDIELRRAQSGKAYCQLVIAVDKNTKNLSTGEWEKKTDWISVNLWEKDAENAEKYIHKGTSVFIEGQLGNRKIETPEGKNTYKLEITVKKLQWEWERISGDIQGNIPAAAEGAPYKSENKVDKDNIPHDDEIPF